MQFHIAAPFFQHIDNLLLTYVSQTSQNVATLITPAALGSFSIYLLFHAYQQMAGNTEQPFMEFLHNSLRSVVILGSALGIGDYNQIVVQMFQNSPVELAAAIGDPTQSGSISSLGSFLDQVLSSVYTIADSFWSMGGVLSEHGLVMYSAGSVVALVGFVVTLIVAALVILSKVATALMLALGPLPILLLMHKSTQNYFNSWLNQLVNYGMLMVLAVGTNGLMLSVFYHTAQKVEALGGAAGVNDIVPMVFIGACSLFLLYQVTHIAASLSNGMALNTFGAGHASAKAAGKATISGGKMAIKGASQGVKIMKERMRSPNEISEDGSRTTRKGPRVEATRRTINFD